MEILKKLPDSESQNWVETGSIIESNIDAFLTEEHDKLAISFSIDFSATLRDVDSGSEYGGKARIEGECSLNIDNYSISNDQLGSVSILRLDGTTLRRSVYAHVGGPYMGRRTIPTV